MRDEASPSRSVGFTLSVVALVLLGLITWALLPPAKSLSPLVHPQLHFRDCGVHYFPRHEVQCYHFLTREGGEFRLPLALIQARGEVPRSARELVILVPGGPGQGGMTSAEEIRFWVDWLQAGRIDADFLLYDPRGTGEAGFQCGAYDTALRELLVQALPLAEELRVLAEAFRRCAADFHTHLHTRHAVPIDAVTATFSTARNAADLQSLIQALGYAQTHLLGVSYGTRLALLTAQQTRIKSLILDSPYPFAYGSDEDVLARLAESVALHRQLYNNYPAKRFSDYDALLAALHSRLPVGSHTVRAELLRGHERLLVQLNEQRIHELGMNVLYSWYHYQNFYLALETFALEGRISTEFELVMGDFLSAMLDRNFNHFVFAATECADNPRSDAAALARLIQRYPGFASVFQASWTHDWCDYIGVETQQPLLLATAYPTVPSLLLVGTHDPVTPPDWARHLHGLLARSQLYVQEGVGHGVLFSADCDLHFVAQWLREPGQPLDIACGAPTLWH